MPLATPPDCSSFTSEANSSRLSRSCLKGHGVALRGLLSRLGEALRQHGILPTAAMYSELKVAWARIHHHDPRRRPAAEKHQQHGQQLELPAACQPR